MNTLTFSLVLTGVLLNAAAQLALKASVRATGSIALNLSRAWPVALRLVIEPWLWLGIGCYVVSVVVWLLALSRAEVEGVFTLFGILFF